MPWVTHTTVSSEVKYKFEEVPCPEGLSWGHKYKFAEAPCPEGINWGLRKLKKQKIKGLLPSRSRPGGYSDKLIFSLFPMLSGLAPMSRRLVRRWNPDENPVKGSSGLRTGLSVDSTGKLMSPCRPRREGFRISLETTGSRH